MDVGIHLTLTSEWQYYRSGSAVRRNEVARLVDGVGFPWRRVEEVVSLPREHSREDCR